MEKRTEMLDLLRGHVGQPLQDYAVGLTKWLNGNVESVSDEGMIRLSFEVRDDMLNALGILHGGVMSAILDEAMGMQLFLLNAEANYVAIGLHVDFINKAMPGQRITAVPNVTRIGRSVAHTTCELYAQDGKLLAKASSNFARFG